MNINLRSIALILVALVFAGAAALLARSFIAPDHKAKGGARVAPEIVGVQVAVARQNFPSGYIIQAKDLQWQAWPDADMAAGYILKSKGGSLEEFQGAVVRQGMLAGDPVTWGRVIKKGDRGYMSALLTPGMRAFSLKVNADTGVSGFLFPGDRVDLILSHSITRKNAKGEDIVNQATETILTNTRILAIDQRAEDQENKPTIVKTVTIEVTPKQAEGVALAEAMGQLSLALHSLAKTDQEMAEIARKGPNAALTPETPAAGGTYTWDSQLSRVISPGGGIGPKSQVQLSRGSESQTVEFQR